jgi:hypothetical protein
MQGKVAVEKHLKIDETSGSESRCHRHRKIGHNDAQKLFALS